MRQLTIYINPSTEKRIRAAARQAHLSLSKWVASLVRERTATTWPKEIADLAGAWSDLPSAQELRHSKQADVRRETI